MDFGDILRTSAQIITQRKASYGPPTEGFERAAVIASTALDKSVSPYEVAMILHAVKLARISTSPKYLDNYVDAVSYLAFAGDFADAGSERPHDTKAPAGRSVEPLRGGPPHDGAAPGPPADRAAP